MVIALYILGALWLALAVRVSFLSQDAARKSQVWDDIYAVKKALAKTQDDDFRVVQGLLPRIEKLESSRATDLIWADAEADYVDRRLEDLQAAIDKIATASRSKATK